LNAETEVYVGQSTIVVAMDEDQKVSGNGNQETGSTPLFLCKTPGPGIIPPLCMKRRRSKEVVYTVLVNRSEIGVHDA
jgi:hypothetical protein